MAKDGPKKGLYVEESDTPAPTAPKKRLRQRKTYTLSDRTVEHIRELGTSLGDSDSRIVDRAIEDYYKRVNGLSDEEYMQRNK